MDVHLDLENRRLKNIFALQKNLLKFTGISLEETQSLFYRVYSLSVLFLMMTIPFVQIYTAIIYIYDIELFTEILTYPLFTVTVSIKLAIILKNQTNLRKNLEKFEKDVFIPRLERGGIEEYILVNNCTLTANKLIKICATGVVMVTIALPAVSVSMSVLSGDCHKWQFAFGPILNVTCTPYVYPVSIYQVTVMSYHGLSYVSIFFLFITVLMHLRCHFKILQNAIKRMVENGRQKSEKELFLPNGCNSNSVHEISPKYLNRSLKEIVTYHESIINLTEEFKKLFSPILLILFVADLFLLGYMMTLTLECPTESVKCSRGILCYIVLIALLFVVSYWGNQINSESENVAKACCEVDFVGIDPKVQKCLVLIIERSQRPCMFTAGGFVDLSLDSFTQILRGSYSYFMLLYNAKNNDL